MIRIKKSKKGKWFFSIIAKNGKILAHSEEYSSSSKAIKGVVACIKSILCFKGIKNLKGGR